jgi:hypothetical protein
MLMVAGGPQSGKTFSLVGLPRRDVGLLPRLLITLFHQLSIQQQQQQLADSVNTASASAAGAAAATPRAQRRPRFKSHIPVALSISYALIDHTVERVRDALHIESAGAHVSAWPFVANAGASVRDASGAAAAAAHLSSVPISSPEQGMRLLVPPYYSVHFNNADAQSGSDSPHASLFSSIIVVDVAFAARGPQPSSENVRSSSSTSSASASAFAPMSSRLLLVELSPHLVRAWHHMHTHSHSYSHSLHQPPAAALPLTTLELARWWHLVSERHRRRRMRHETQRRQRRQQHSGAEHVGDGFGDAVHSVALAASASSFSATQWHSALVSQLVALTAATFSNDSAAAPPPAMDSSSSSSISSSLSSAASATERESAPELAILLGCVSLGESQKQVW